MLLAFLLSFFTHLRKLLYAADFSEVICVRIVGAKNVGLETFLLEKNCWVCWVFLVLFCSFIFPLSKQLFYWSTTGSSSKLLSGKSISIMIIPICFVKRNSCLYSICFNNVHLNIHYIFRVDTDTARVFMSCK